MIRSRWAARGLAVLVLMALTAVACGGGGPKQAQDTRPIVVGGTLGLTGPFAGPSAVYKAVYDYWLEKVNKSGGLLGRPVKMIVYDDEGTPATAQTLYNRLVRDDKVDLLLAPYTTLVGGSIIPIAQSNRMTLWNGGFTGIELFTKADNIIGAYTYQEPDYPRAIFELVDTLSSDQRPKKLALLTEQNPFPIFARDGYQGQGGALNYAKQRGIQVVLNEEYASSTNNFDGLVQRAKSAGADMFVSLSLPNPSTLIAKSVNQQGYKPLIYCSCGSQVTTLPNWPSLGAAANAVFATTMALPGDNYPGDQEIFAYLQQKFSYKELPAYATVAYTILQVMEQSVKGARTLDQRKLHDYALRHTFDTANGSFGYDKYGFPTYSSLLVQFQSGKNVAILPAKRATGKPIIPLP